MKAIFFLVFSLALFWTSCSEKSTNSEANGVARDSTMSISGFSRELVLTVPLDFASNNKPANRYNEMTGEIEITAGEGFHVVCTEESLSIAQLKEELEADLLFSYRYDTENSNELVFVQILPDGAEVSYHFIRRFELPGITLIARSDPSREFTLHQIQTMMSILGNLKSRAS